MKVTFSPEDAAAMEADLVQIGRCYVEVTRPGDLGKRLNPLKIKVKINLPKKKDRPEPAPEKSQTYIYFVSDGRNIKIGISTDPDKRAAMLQTSHSARLEILGTQKGDRQLERDLHDRFRNHRQLGEWFKDAPEIRDYIAEFTDQNGHKSQTEVAKSPFSSGQVHSKSLI